MATDKALTAEDLRQFQKPIIKPVRLPALGGTLYVRSMTSGEGDDWEYEQTVRQKRNADLQAFTARTLIRVLCHEDGTLLYPPAGHDPQGRPLWTEAQIAELASLPKGALDKAWHVARELSKITEEDVRELLGNSGGAPSAASGSV